MAFFSLWNSAFLQVNNSRKWMAEISDTEGNIFLQIRIWMRNKTYMGILQLRIFLLLLNILCKALKKTTTTHTQKIYHFENYFFLQLWQEARWKAVRKEGSSGKSFASMPHERGWFQRHYYFCHFKSYCPHINRKWLLKIFTIVTCHLYVPVSRV